MGSCTVTDFHTHILPEMDDGSRSVDESLRMLSESLKQDVGRIALTPHFYADRDTPEHFLEKRQHCYEKLCACLKESSVEFPKLCLGAEIAYFEGLSQMKDLEKFKITGTDALLIEMPFRPWTERLLADVSDLARHSGFTVILAHFERYDACADERILKKLALEGVLLQTNANCFLRLMARAKALRRFDEGLVHLIGSDCHNIDCRPPNLGKALDFIKAKRGNDAVRGLINRGERLFLAD